MALYAVDDLEDALDATRALLLPFDAGRWLRLALVALFVAGGSGTTTPTVSYQFPAGPNGGLSGYPLSPDRIGPEVEPYLPIVLAVAAIVVLLALALALAGSVFEFVFVASLRAEAVHVRRYFRRHFGRGLRLFGFRIALGLVGVAVSLVFAAAVVGPVVVGADAVVSVVVALVLVPLFLLLGLTLALVHVFTTAFVVPVMLLEDRGVLSAWRRFWPTLTANLRQFAAFVVVGFVLNLALGVLAGVLLAIPAALLAAPVAALVGAGVFIGVSPLLLGGVVLLAFVFGLLFAAVAAVVQAPIQTYLRYYALFVLGDVNAEFDLLPERRAAVREP